MMSNFARFKYLGQKLWKSGLAAIEQPRQIPNLSLLLLKGVHFGELLKLNQRWIKQVGIRTVIDIGAHTGEFSSAIRAILPGVRVYAFEPLPDCFAKLTAKFKKDGGYRAFQTALGAQDGKVEFRRSSFSKSSSVLPMATLHHAVFPWSASCSPVEIQLGTLDGYAGEMELTSKVLMKIDVQGYEDRVLKGSAQVLKQVDYVLVEVSFRSLYEGQAGFGEVYNFLLESGFSYAGNLEQWVSPLDDSVLQADALFVKQG
jgi:FkbM family methyltransferase